MDNIDNIDNIDKLNKDIDIYEKNKIKIKTIIILTDDNNVKKIYKKNFFIENIIIYMN